MLFFNEIKRSEIIDFGIPEDKKFPLDSIEHVKSAIKLFGHAEESKKKSLAQRIATKAKEYNIEIPETTQVYKYLKEEQCYENDDDLEIPDIRDSVDRRTVTEILDDTDLKHIYLTSDWHIFKNRYKKEANYVNTSDIISWCKKNIKSDDVFMYLGDMSYRWINDEDREEVKKIFKSLPGIKILIIGNHDGKLLKNDIAMGYFDSVEKMMHVSDNGVQICLCHFPIAEWNGYYKGHVHIYGHIHNKKDETWEFMKTRKNAYNAGCMLYGYTPASLNEIVRIQSTIYE